jgi:hypothetical protein
VVSWPSLALPAVQPELGLTADQTAQAAALINIGAAVVPFFVGERQHRRAYKERNKKLRKIRITLSITLNMDKVYLGSCARQYSCEGAIGQPR